MERQQLDPLTEMVENKKKKRKSVLKIVLGIIGSLLAVIAIAGFFIYQNGNITGKWENPSLAAELRQIGIHQFQSGVDEFQINPEEFVGKSGLVLEVKDNKAVATLYASFNKESLLDSYNQMIENAYNEFLRETEQEAEQYGLSKEAFLKQSFGDNYEAQMKALFPTPEQFEREFDDMMAKQMADNHGQYDRVSGKFSAVYFEGEVSPFTHSITVTKINSSSDVTSSGIDLKPGDVMIYHHSGDTLTFIGGEQYPFKIKN